MTKYRVIQKASTQKYHVQEWRYMGDYDGGYMRWAKTFRRHRRMLNFFLFKIPITTYPKAIFDKEEDAILFMDKLVELDRGIEKDKVIKEIT